MIRTPWTAPGNSRGIPVEVQDEVELWAREQGRHGRITWSPVTNCAVVQLSLKPDDPRMRAYQEGRLKHEPKENVFLHRWEGGRWVAVPPTPAELTPDFVRRWLDRGNMWSGRGESEAANLYDACLKADRRERELYEKARAKIRENTELRSRERRRQVLDLPLVSVPQQVSDS